MKKSVCILVLSICFLFSGNISFATAGKQLPRTILTAHNSIASVLADINAWFGPAYDIAGDDKEALAILSDLEIRMSPAIPDQRPENKRIILLETRSDPMAILVLGKNAGMQWREELKLRTMVHFQTMNEPDSPILTMVFHKHYEPSPLMKGLALLQQGYYVKTCREDVGINYKHKRCFDMLLRLLTKKFGEKYTAQVRNQIEGRPADLDSIYGKPSASDVEEDMRRALLFVHAKFTDIREKTYHSNDKALLQSLVEITGHGKEKTDYKPR